MLPSAGSHPAQDSHTANQTSTETCRVALWPFRSARPLSICPLLVLSAFWLDSFPDALYYVHRTPSWQKCTLYTLRVWCGCGYLLGGRCVQCFMIGAYLD